MCTLRNKHVYIYAALDEAKGGLKNKSFIQIIDANYIDSKHI